ncbi:phosphodiesterase [Natranaerobius trueperi]|uniref:Phosphoesterase n=1 Tax=Natranaerobius trueperi TaxID=759412 RepID=A0A226BZE8_9FIRM|nr:phosphodiesterase [Natranaerobius trueperi]OWZ84403.1 YfcE family phosphodiesterase [Natranaerobius trueperi]
MKIGLISDTHGSSIAFEKAEAILKNCDVILHGGDILYHGPRNPLPDGYDPQKLSHILNNLEQPIYMVQGNCDSKVDQMVLNKPILSPFFHTNLDNLNILLLHGEDYNEIDLVQLAKDYNVKCVITGHTHIPVIKEVEGILLINPGSPSIPKTEDKVPTIGLIDTEENKVQIISNDDKTIKKVYHLY